MEEKVSFFHSDTATVRDKKSKVKDDVLAESVRRHPDKNTKNGDKDSTFSDDHLTYESLDLTSKPKVSGVLNLIALVSEDSGVSSAEDSGQGSDDSTPKSKIKLNRSERNNRSTRSLQRMNEKQLSVKEKGKKSSIKKSEKQSSSEPQETVREKASKGFARIAKKLGIRSKQSDAEKERPKEQNRKSSIKISEDHSRPAKEHAILDLGGGPELGSSSEECDQTNSNTSLTRHGSKRIAPNENKVSDDTNPFDNDMKKKCDEELPRLKWIQNFEIVHSDKKWEKPRLEIVCKLGKVPHTEDIVKLFGEEILQFITYKEVSKADWFESTILDEPFKLKKLFADGLSRLKWVESFKVIDANEECDKRRIKIVLNFDKVPCIDDILELFGEEILPFITYEKFPKTEWFERNIFADKRPKLKKEYNDSLSSLPWIEDFYVTFDSEKDKTWKIYITAAQNQEPSMNDLKEIFGDNIYCFVDFIQKQDDDSESCFLDGPRTGHEFESDGRSGTIAILGVEGKDKSKHYAITCYHVCFGGELLGHLFEMHEDLKEDCDNGSPGCTGISYKYTSEVGIQNLGTYAGGLYNDKHDIGLIKLDQNLNCYDEIEFLRENNFWETLLSEEEVEEIFAKEVKDKGGVDVGKFGSVTNFTRGKLFSIEGKSLGNGMNNGFYRIRRAKDERVFAKKGDSGALVYIICEDGKKKPFAYLSNKYNTAYHCANLKSSLEALNFSVKPCLGDCGMNVHI